MKVHGTIDGVDLTGVSSNLFTLDSDQTIEGTYSFDSPTTSITFGEIVGDGVGGRGVINGQKVEMIEMARKTWKTVAAVKAAAHGDAYALCNQVS